MRDLQDVIPEPNLVILSPHYDDVVLTWGGYLNALAQSGLLKSKRIRVVHLFSRSAYQVRDHKGNQDRSLARIQYATGIRLLEDLNCLDDLLGTGAYEYELKGERECVVRARPWKEGEAFEFPQGTKESFDEEERTIFERFKQHSRQWLGLKQTALLVPLAVKEHVDHVMIRDAVIETRQAMGESASARIYFGEDQPYTGLASTEDWSKAQRIILGLELVPLDYEIDVTRKADLVMRHYPSQVEESYREGVWKRARELGRTSSEAGALERMYVWGAPE